MKLVFLSGPYRAETISGVVRNIREAEGVAISLWRMGFAVIAPHKNTAFFDGLCPDQTWLRGDLEILRRCDMAVFFGFWRESEGACEEFRVAGELGIPQYDWIGDYDAIREVA